MKKTATMKEIIQMKRIKIKIMNENVVIATLSNYTVKNSINNKWEI